jgi:hypothetical protein
MVLPQLDELPFLQSLCWQGETPSIAGLTAAEILGLYERNCRYRGVLVELSPVEQDFVRSLATEYHSWLVNDV